MSYPVKVEFDDGDVAETTVEKLVQLKRSNPEAYSRIKTIGGANGGESFVRGALQGGTFGFSDELAAGAEAAVSFVPGYTWLAKKMTGDVAGTGSLSARYERSRDYYRVRNEVAKKSNPKTYGAGELGGALASTAVPAGRVVKAATLPGRIAAGTAAGARVGALGALGRAEGEGQLAQAAQGALEGAAIGGGFHAVVGAVPTVGRLGKKLIEKIEGPLGSLPGLAGGVFGYKHGDSALNAIIGAVAGQFGAKVAKSVLGKMEKLTWESHQEAIAALKLALEKQGVTQGQIGKFIGGLFTLYDRLPTAAASAAQLTTFEAKKKRLYDHLQEKYPDKDQARDD